MFIKQPRKIFNRATSVYILDWVVWVPGSTLPAHTPSPCGPGGRGVVVPVIAVVARWICVVCRHDIKGLAASQAIKWQRLPHLSPTDKHPTPK